MAKLSLADQSKSVPEPEPEPIVNTRQSGDIQTIAIQHCYTVKDVPGDGNCLFSALLIGMKESGIQATSPAELRDNVVNFLKTADRDTVAHSQGFLTNPTHVDHTIHTGNDAEMQEDVDHSIAMIVTSGIC